MEKRESHPLHTCGFPWYTACFLFVSKGWPGRQHLSRGAAMTMDRTVGVVNALEIRVSLEHLATGVARVVKACRAVHQAVDGTVHRRRAARRDDRERRLQAERGR